MEPRASGSRRPLILLGVLAVTIIALLPTAALGGAAFDDVPDDHTHAADIAWLKQAGVTKGCNPPLNTNFCPENPVTRAQMATFMKNLHTYLGGAFLAIDGTAAEAKSSDLLDGLDSTAFLPGGTPPAGTTVRGTYALGNKSDASWASISWGFEMPSPPQAFFRPAGSASTRSCPGSPSNPQAAPGVLCVYETSENNATLQQLFAPGSGSPGADTFGAIINAQPGIASDFNSYGTWAVTVGGGS